jgi:predicted transcriptional regulator of viral defense system
MLASEQAGYFTAQQAAESGWNSPLLTYHARSGTVQRIHTGVYRFRDFPFSPHEEIVAAWLAAGKETTVVSHESALNLWSLTDLIPDAVHLMVPRKQRNLPKLPGVKFHTATRRLREGDVWPVEVFKATSPQRTLLDVATAGQSPEHVIIGIRQARAKGWISESRLRTEGQQRGARVIEMIEQALEGDESDRRGRR